MAPSESSQIRVLHVDDEPDFADMASTFLQRADERLAVETATSADEGLDRLSDEKFDCIVSDYDMPEQNGIEFLRAVRETYPDLPFILYTGKGSEEVASEAISAGVSDYLQKETGTDQYTVLANRMANLVSQYRAVSAVEEYASEREESERYRQRLIEIISDSEVSDSRKIDRLLALGCERLDVENGHLVVINEATNRHEVVSVFGSEVVREGVTDLSETYCRKTIESDGILDVNHAGEQGWTGDTAYEAFGLECYIGGKLTGEGRLFGTLCFVDPEPREPFTTNEKAFFDLLVQWFSQMLERRRRLNQADVIFDHVQDAIFLIDVADDETFTISSVNRAYEDVTEYSSADLRGQTPRDLLGGDQGAEVEARFRECLEKREPIEYDGQLTIGDSTKHWHTRLAPVVEDGRIVQLVGATRDITKQKERERELERHQRFLETTTDVITVIDSDGVIQYDSPAIRDVLGYEPGERLGEYGFEYVHPDDRVRLKEVFERELTEKDEPIESAECRVRHKTGSWIWTDSRANYGLVESTGEIVVSIRDITERKEDEQNYEQFVDLLNHTQQIADVGGWEIDPETEDVFWSDHLFEMLGWEDDEEPPLDEALDVYHEEDRPIVEDAVETALDSGEAFDIEVRFRRPDGELRWLRVRGSPTIENDEVVTLRGAVHDITDRLRRERVLRDMHGIISDRNRSFEAQVEDLLRLGRAELDTSYGTLSRISGDEYLFEVVDADDDSIEAGDVVPVSATNCEIAASTERTLVLGDIERDAPEESDRAGFTEWGISCYLGAPVFVDEDVYGTFCFYDTDARSGQFSGWEVTLVDLMSKWVSYELEHREANERLRDKNLQLEEVTSIISHDLRNPLNVAEGRVALAMEECDSDHLDNVVMAHDRMGALIDDMLTLARQGNAVEDAVQVSLSHIAERCWDVVNLSEAQLKIETTREFTADASRLQQLLENLFRNAIDHAGDDVTITVGALDDGFFVADDGRGIPATDRSTVFDEGYTTNDEGTGFGLPIVKQIADAHGWSVSVTEGEYGGARFEITGIDFE